MSNKINFGGFGGKIEQFGGNTGGKQLVIRSGTVVDFIQIGANTVGGSGGVDITNVPLPSDGIIILYTVSKYTRICFYFFFLFRISKNYIYVLLISQVSVTNFENRTVVGFLDFCIGGRRYTNGKARDQKYFDSPAGTPAKIIAVYGEKYIDSITFELLASSANHPLGPGQPSQEVIL